MGFAGNSWDRLLKPDFLEEALMWSEHQRTKHTVYPETENVLKAFELTPPEKTRVVIIGQDPYPGVGADGIPHAHGLAFSTKSTTVPQSLQNIFAELDYLYGYKRQHGDLTDWAKQGVLLLNTSLTVQAGKPASHRNKFWDRVTVNAIRALSISVKRIVFMLWGRDAQAMEPYISKPGNHRILKAPHPSPLSAHTGFYGCGHFAIANQHILTMAEYPQSTYNRSHLPITWV